MFGGGLAIASGFVESGLLEWISFPLTGLQGVNCLVIFLTEAASNTAAAAMMHPMTASLAAALGFHVCVNDNGRNSGVLCIHVVGSDSLKCCRVGAGDVRITDM